VRRKDHFIDEPEKKEKGLCGAWCLKKANSEGDLGRGWVLFHAFREED